MRVLLPSADSVSSPCPRGRGGNTTSRAGAPAATRRGAGRGHSDWCRRTCGGQPPPPATAGNRTCRLLQSGDDLIADSLRVAIAPARWMAARRSSASARGWLLAEAGPGQAIGRWHRTARPGLRSSFAGSQIGARWVTTVQPALGGQGAVARVGGRGERARPGSGDGRPGEDAAGRRCRRGCLGSCLRTIS